MIKNKVLRPFLITKRRLALASLLLFSQYSLAFLPNGKMMDFSIREQTSLYNYKITGDIGYVSHLSHIFSAEKTKLVIQSKNSDKTREINCDEMTLELKNSYILCTQGSQYISLNLKTDKISNIFN